MAQNNNFNTDLIAPSYEEIKQMYDWQISTNEDIAWYVDMGVIDKEDYALITGEKFPEENTSED